MNKILRPPELQRTISHGGTENWVRKENLAAEAKAVRARAVQFNARGAGELCLLTKLKNIQRVFRLLNLSSLASLGSREVISKQKESHLTTA